MSYNFITGHPGKAKNKGRECYAELWTSSQPDFQTRLTAIISARVGIPTVTGNEPLTP